MKTVKSNKTTKYAASFHQPQNPTHEC